MIDYAHLHCPHCGEPFETVVDLSAGDMDYVEDCPVCCRPIELQLRIDSDTAMLDAPDDDADPELESAATPSFSLRARGDRD